MLLLLLLLLLLYFSAFAAVLPTLAKFSFCAGQHRLLLRHLSRRPPHAHSRTQRPRLRRLPPGLQGPEQASRKEGISQETFKNYYFSWLLQIRLRLPVLRPRSGLEGGLPRLPPPAGGGGDGAQAGRHGAVVMKGGPGPSWMYFFCKDDFDLVYFC